jgi:nucleoside-diphosphate-sugar epimerase
MKVLVTGANGFVGRCVVPALQRAGHEVRIAQRGAEAALAMTATPPVETVTVGDIGPTTDWSGALTGIDAVVHLAARVHVMRDHPESEVEFTRTNTAGTLALAQAAARQRVARLIFVSTIKVNGEYTLNRPFNADDEPRPMDAYARSKHAAEIALREIQGLATVIIRPPLVYGPGAKGNLERFCRLAERGWPLPIGAIRNRRDLVGVDNLASLIVTCVTHPAAVGQVFLAADGQSLSTPALYRAIADGMHRPARVFPVPVTLLRGLARLLGMGSEIDRLTQSLEIDSGKTRQVLEWLPPIPVRQGLAHMANDYRERRRTNS